MDEEEVIDSNQIAQQAMADEQLPDGAEEEKKEPEVDNSKMVAFTYHNEKGQVAKRYVYKVHEDESSIVGFDFNKLTESEKKVVHKVFDSFEITPPPAPGTTSLNYASLGINKAIFNKAYRTFLRKNIY
jgi:hypothetical protein